MGAAAAAVFYGVQDSIEVIETFDGKLKTEAQVRHD